MDLQNKIKNPPRCVLELWVVNITLSSCSLSTCECEEDGACLKLSLGVFTPKAMKHIFRSNESSVKQHHETRFSIWLCVPISAFSLSLSCGHTCTYTHTHKTHTPRNALQQKGPANALFPCRAPRATGCICVTEAGPAAMGLGLEEEVENG